MSNENPVMVDGKLGTLRGICHAPQGTDTGWSAIFLHGYFSCTHVGPARLYVQMARALALAGIETWRVDCFGVGDSDGSFTETTYPSEMADYQSIIDHVKATSGGRKLALIGHSLGASIAIRIAAADPDIERVWLVSPTVGPFSNPENIFWESQQEELQEEGRTVRKSTVIQQSFIESIVAEDVYDLAGKLPSKPVVFYGSEDQYFDRASIDRLIQSIPNGHLIAIEDADHNFMKRRSRPNFLLALREELRDRWV